MKLFIAIAFAFSFACAHAAASSGVVKGTVVTTSGQPVTKGVVHVTIDTIVEPSAPLDSLGNYNETVTWSSSSQVAAFLQADAPGFLNTNCHDYPVFLDPGGSVLCNITLSVDPDYIFSNDFEASL